MPDELNLEEVIAKEPDALEDNEKSFLEENKADLSDENLEKFGLEKGEEEEKDDEDEDVDPEKIEIETRTKPVKKDKDKKSDEDDEVDPDDEKTISKIVDQRLKEAGVGDAKDQLEVDSFIRSKPEFGKYRAVILKYMSNPSYNNIPAHNIAAMVSATDMQKIGAQKEREASKKAKETQGGGTTARKAKGAGTDWASATKEEYEAKRAEIGYRG